MYFRGHACWPEKKGFLLVRRADEPEYIFLHFLTPAELILKGERVRVEAGACIVYPPFAKRYIEATEQALLHDWFHADCDLMPILNHYGLQTETVYYPGAEREITQIVREMELSKLREDAFLDEFYRIKLEELFLRISRGIKGERHKTVNPEMQKQLLMLRNDIQMNFWRIHDVEELSECLHLSQSRFYAVYRQMFGISPKQDLLNVRIAHAKQLLQQKQYSVAEVAEMVGYQNPYHFIRQFKKMVGTTPGKFQSGQG